MKVIALSICAFSFFTACSQAHAPTDFAFKIDDYTATVNTFNNTYTRHGIRTQKNDPSVFKDTTIVLQLTPGQNDSIYLLLGQTGFFTMPEKIAAPCQGREYPSGEDNLLVTANGQTKKLLIADSQTM
ncbi:hypothetical protein [Hymenobacter sp. CRA2]|uniref:hypothetical protein n=1 Tax=Hymenobacter sp. CRA2 TaxID=1955620 RepID=UPI001115E814|nr:hypothetical protein [Hymenobacter sp. CRA2]